MDLLARFRVAVVARAVAPLHGVGGLERSVHDLVTHLSAEGVQVTLITPPPRVPLAAPPFASTRITLCPVRYLTFPFANRRGTTILDRSTAYPIFGLRAGRVARARVRTGQIDLVHGFGASVLGYALARRHETAPLVFNPQGLEEFGATAGAQSFGKRVGYWPLRRAVRSCSRHADAVIATDAALERTVTRHLDTRPAQRYTIPNGIDLVATDALASSAEGRRLRARHRIDPDETVLLSVGRLEHNKGFDVMAEALARLSSPEGSAASRPWRWIVAGAGPFQRQLERQVASCGIASRVVFTGRVTESELHAWYEAATLFVHPTRYEGSSLVTLEAMAHHKPVVATVAGGLPDKVRPDVNGWLVPPGDAPALARAIAGALADPMRLLTMGIHSRRIVELEFAWSVLIHRYLELYAELRLRASFDRDTR